MNKEGLVPENVCGRLLLMESPTVIYKKPAWCIRESQCEYTEKNTGYSRWRRKKIQHGLSCRTTPMGSPWTKAADEHPRSGLAKDRNVEVCSLYGNFGVMTYGKDHWCMIWIYHSRWNHENDAEIVPRCLALLDQNQKAPSISQAGQECLRTTYEQPITIGDLLSLSCQGISPATRHHWILLKLPIFTVVSQHIIRFYRVPCLD